MLLGELIVFLYFRRIIYFNKNIKQRINLFR